MTNQEKREVELQKKRFKAKSKTLLKFLGYFLLFVVISNVLFHVIMSYEGRDYTIVEGIYWSMVTMATLGYGDIVFTSDIGLIFSTVVLLSGVVFLLVFFPYIFIQFFYTPWMEAVEQSKAPRVLSKKFEGHVILTKADNVTYSLVERLNQFQIDYVFISESLEEALTLNDKGYNVMLGSLDDPQTYRNARISQATLLVATNNDKVNSNIAFTANEINRKLPIVTTADSEDSEDILKLAGSTFVIQTARMIGQTLARRTLGGSARIHVIAHFENLVIGEAPAIGTPLVGKTIAESNLRNVTGMNAVGFWERGSFKPAQPDKRIDDHTVLVMVGTVEQMRRYDELFGIYNALDAPVLIIGAGRVGQTVAKALDDRRVNYKVIDKDISQVKKEDERYVAGDAADLKILRKCGIDEAHTIIITTNNDDMNIYLTIYCRSLRPDIQITSRASLERNVSTLHRAGADFVMAYSTMGANAIFNVLRRNQVLMLAEGINLFRVKVDNRLHGKSILDSRIRENTGCTIVSLKEDDTSEVNPDPQTELKKGQELILIGTLDNEKAFMKYYQEKPGKKLS